MSKKKSKVVSYPRSTALQLCLFQFDKNNNEVWTSALIQSILDKHKGGYISYSYILHDKDTYTAQGCCDQEERNKQAYINYYRIAADSRGFEKDETQPCGYIFDAELDNKAKEFANEHFPVIYPGQKKLPHFHVNVIFSQRRCCDEIARWFGVIPEAVKAFTGRGGAQEAELYLVHQKQTEKYQYDASAVVASFDYVNMLEEHLNKVNRQQAYHQYTEDDINDLVNDVESGKYHPDDVKKMLTFAVYNKHAKAFTNARQEYLCNNKEMPALRHSYYVYETEYKDKDKGGMGKTILTHLFAKSLAESYYDADVSYDYDSKYMKRFIYDAGEKGVALQSYDGQPILVINDCGGDDMIKAFGGRQEIKELLDLHPVKRDKNIKFGKTQVFAEHIIINGISDFDTFVSDMVKGSRDDGKAAGQFYRRMWAIFNIVDENYFNILFNKGIFSDTKEWRSWIELKRIRATFDKNIARLGGAAGNNVCERLFSPVHNKLIEYDKSHPQDKITNIEEIPSYFDDFGLDADAVALRNALRSLDINKLTPEARAYLSSEEVLNKLPDSLAALIKTFINGGEELESAVNAYVLDSRDNPDSYIASYSDAASELSAEVDSWNEKKLKADIPSDEASALLDLCLKFNERLSDVRDDKLIPLAAVLIKTVSGLIEVVAPAAGADVLPFPDNP